MSKRDPGNPADAQETSVQSTNGANNMHELEHRLIQLNVNDHVEKKQGLSYLSWAWAWQEALRIDPAATFNVHTFDGKPYMDVNGTGMVWVSVNLGSRARSCFLPVMDYKNKAITNPDSFQVNTAIMRCLTKCLAMFGLGLYIYAGEDLPPSEEPATKEPAKEVQAPAVDGQEVANLKLFSESVIELIAMSDSEKDLRSYWKANQTTLDKLKAALPDDYARVVAQFTSAKLKLQEKASA